MVATGNRQCKRTGNHVEPPETRGGSKAKDNKDTKDSKDSKDSKDAMDSVNKSMAV